MIILLRNTADKDTDKLIKYRNDLKKEITINRKTKLKNKDEELPTMEYLEKQLDEAYNVYMRNSMKQSKEYMSKEDFRTMFEELMEVVYEHD